MQRLAGKSRKRAARLVGQGLQFGAARPAIGLIADQWMADRGHMYANLMGAAGGQAAFHQADRAARERGDDAIAGVGVLAAMADEDRKSIYPLVLITISL